MLTFRKKLPNTASRRVNGIIPEELSDDAPDRAGRHYKVQPTDPAASADFVHRQVAPGLLARFVEQT